MTLTSQVRFVVHFVVLLFVVIFSAWKVEVSFVFPFFCDISLSLVMLRTTYTSTWEILPVYIIVIVTQLLFFPDFDDLCDVQLRPWLCARHVGSTGPNSFRHGWQRSGRFLVLRGVHEKGVAQLRF